MKPQTPPPPTRLERVLSALWIAAVTALAIPALIATFSRDSARPIQMAPLDEPKAVEILEGEDLDRNENANLVSAPSNR